MLIDFLDMFLGAFNHFFNPSFRNYYWFAQILSISVLIVVLITTCLTFLIILKNLLNIIFKMGGRK